MSLAIRFEQEYQPADGYKFMVGCDVAGEKITVTVFNRIVISDEIYYGSKDRVRDFYNECVKALLNRQYIEPINPNRPWIDDESYQEEIDAVVVEVERVEVKPIELLL